jgi:hypothetical protein
VTAAPARKPFEAFRRLREERPFNPAPLADQITELEFELHMIEKITERKVGEGKLDPRMRNLKLWRLRSALHTLRRVHAQAAHTEDTVA